MPRKLPRQTLKKMMRHRSKPVHLVVDGLPAHKTARVRDYVASTNGLLTLYFHPGYAPEPNPDELVWSDMKRTEVARTPPRKGERPSEKIAAQLAAIKRMHSSCARSSRLRVSPLLSNCE